MKKYLSLILVFAMMLSIMVPASAVHIPDGNNAEQVDSNNIFLEKLMMAPFLHPLAKIALRQ